MERQGRQQMEQMFGKDCGVVEIRAVLEWEGSVHTACQVSSQSGESSVQGRDPSRGVHQGVVSMQRVFRTTALAVAQEHLS